MWELNKTPLTANQLVDQEFLRKNYRQLSHSCCYPAFSTELKKVASLMSQGFTEKGIQTIITRERSDKKQIDAFVIGEYVHSAIETDGKALDTLQYIDEYLLKEREIGGKTIFGINAFETKVMKKVLEGLTYQEAFSKIYANKDVKEFRETGVVNKDLQKSIDNLKYRIEDYVTAYQEAKKNGQTILNDLVETPSIAYKAIHNGYAEYLDSEARELITTCVANNWSLEYEKVVLFAKQGIPCKILVDVFLLSPNQDEAIIIDHKTSRDHVSTYLKQYSQHRHDLQASFYTDGILAGFPSIKKATFYFSPLFIYKGGSLLLRVSEEDLETGRNGGYHNPHSTLISPKVLSASISHGLLDTLKSMRLIGEENKVCGYNQSLTIWTNLNNGVLPRNISADDTRPFEIPDETDDFKIDL